MPHPETTLRVAADLRNLAQMRRFVRAAAEAAGADTSAAWDLVQAVDESATNVIVHGYRGDEGSLEIGVRLDGDRVVVCIRDDAPPFDPTAVPVPDMDQPLDRRPLGGMGVHLTRELTDEVRHRALEAGGNELTLIKRIAADTGRRESGGAGGEVRAWT
jgi:anti-sigma regulatory factor (Ser/Thr protein kinase)